MKYLSTNEWLQKEGYGDGEYNAKELSLLFERYANHKTAHLQAVILDFRQQLIKKADSVGLGDELGALLGVLYNFDEAFGITELRNGQI
jgi:hypothetical protein